MHQAEPPYEVLTPPRRCAAGEQLRVVWVPESDVDVLWTPWSLALAGTADPSA